MFESVDYVLRMSETLIKGVGDVMDADVVDDGRC